MKGFAICFTVCVLLINASNATPVDDLTKLANSVASALEMIEHAAESGPKDRSFPDCL